MISCGLNQVIDEEFKDEKKNDYLCEADNQQNSFSLFTKDIFMIINKNVKQYPQTDNNTDDDDEKYEKHVM